METSTNFGFNLPSRDNDDIADINQISDNFRIIDEIMKETEQTFSGTSENPQSGIAVAQAVETCSPAIVTASDTGKALSIPDSAEGNIKGLTAYGESAQDGTPTPDSPVEIVSVENPVISVYGKNLFDKDTMIISGAYVSGTGQYQTSASSEKTAIIPVPKNSTVTFSKIVTSILRVGLCTVYPTSGTQLVSFQDVSNKKSFTAATGNNSYLVAFFYNNEGETVNYEEVINSIQLEIGSTVTNYEPYTVQTVTVPYTFAEGDMLILNNGIVKVNISGQEIDITTTEAGQALLALKTNYPTTSVISDIDLNLTYRADTKNYIDNKFAALTALTLEG